MSMSELDFISGGKQAEVPEAWVESDLVAQPKSIILMSPVDGLNKIFSSFISR